MISNTIQCKHCRSIITSTYRHDFKRCLCGKVAVDGGNDYLSRSYTSEDDYIELAYGDNVPLPLNVHVESVSVYGGVFKVIEIVDACTIKVSPAWTWTNPSWNVNLSGCIVKINDLKFFSLVLEETFERLLAVERLKSLIADKYITLYVSRNINNLNIVEIRKGVMSADVFLNDINIFRYFPDFDKAVTPPSPFTKFVNSTVQSLKTFFHIKPKSDMGSPVHATPFQATTSAPEAPTTTAVENQPAMDNAPESDEQVTTTSAAPAPLTEGQVGTELTAAPEQEPISPADDVADAPNYPDVEAPVKETATYTPPTTDEVEASIHEEQPAVTEAEAPSPESDDAERQRRIEYLVGHKGMTRASATTMVDSEMTAEAQATTTESTTESENPPAAEETPQG